MPTVRVVLRFPTGRFRVYGYNKESKKGMETDLQGHRDKLWVLPPPSNYIRGPIKGYI